ncbi:EAL domain-containing protein [Halomonas vilamensis]|uniref:EAL domain-containing protein n=1 Tax=Vreelandella vilamensis TaxID=531309 RepID=A0ABU1H7M5_9GAMM|nr:EAL domain-containing protein [Halomonas vilamensis]MDR5900301.1 EAL domain-containing protein [Halomonas vilamensis]
MSALQDRLFRQAIDQAYGSVLITTAELDLPGPTIVYANAAFCEQSGYTQEELIGQTPRILQGPETDRAVLNRLRTALAQSGAFDGQIINYRKNGTPYRVRWSIRPIRDDQQRITHYISLQSDITDISVTRDEFTRQAELLKMAEKTMRFGGWFIDLKTNRVEWSNIVAEIHGMPHGFSPTLSQAIAYYIPEHREEIRERFTACVERGIPYDEELQIRAADGKRVWVRTLGEPIRDGSERIVGVRGAFQDVTQRREREQELRKLAYITEQSPAPITVTDLSGHIEYVNRAFETVSGYSRDALIGNTPTMIQSGQTPKATYRDLWDTIKAGNVWSGEIQNRRQDGTPYWERELISPLTDDLGEMTHFVAIKQDITAIKQAQQELSLLAYTDPLTGLHNRNGFSRQLERHLEEHAWNPEGAVVAMDIAGLRDINDVYGYDIGDRLLTQFGQRLSDISENTVLAGRIGGDEFMALIVPGSGDSLDDCLDRVLKTLSPAFDLSGFDIGVKFRVGCTRLGENKRSVEPLLREAERALALHREEPLLPWVAYSDRIQKNTDKRLAMTRELQQALAEDQLELHFQPKVDLATGTLIACEALLRWNHPKRGLVSPGEFIPIAEQSQLIAPIGDWVLRRACQHLREWRDAGLEPVRVAVNVSVIQFQASDFASRVRTVLEQSDVAPEELALEVTESVFEGESDTLRNQMDALRDMGVWLSLDDFGTGYSSLLYLNRYPFNEIKIDQGFIFSLLSDSFSQHIVETVVVLAKALDAEIIAEGIESAAIADKLIAMGCRFGQGFFYSMPLEAEDFRWLLEQRSKLPLTAV